MMLGALVVLVTVSLFVRAGTAACAEAVVRAGSYSTGCKETLLAPSLVTHPTTPLFQITPVINTGLSLSEPLQLYKGSHAI